MGGREGAEGGREGGGSQGGGVGPGTQVEAFKWPKCAAPVQFGSAEVPKCAAGARSAVPETPVFAGMAEQIRGRRQMLLIRARASNIRPADPSGGR